MVELIYLNIGGKKFTTTRSTLEKSSFFRTFLEKNLEEYFIDRCGRMFKHVMRLLINPMYPFPEEFNTELVFYGIVRESKEKIVVKQQCIVACDFNSRSIDIYDSDGKILRQLPLEDGQIRSIVLSPNNEFIVSRGTNILVWNVITRKILHKFDTNSDDVRSLAFSNNSKWIAMGHHNGLINIYDISTATKISELNSHKDRVRCLAFSHDGKILVSGSDDKTIKMFEVRNWTLMLSLTAHQSPVYSIAFSPDDQKFISGAENGSIKIWSFKNYQWCKNIQHDTWITNVAFSKDGTQIATKGDNNNIYIYDSQTYELLHTLRGPAKIETLFQFSRRPRENWKLQFPTFRGHDRFINNFNFSPDSLTLVSGGNDNSIKIWDTKSGCLIKTIKTNSIVESVNFLLQ